MASIGLSSHSSNLNSNTAESNLTAPSSGTGFWDLPDLAVKRMLSFLDPRDAVNFRLISRRGPEIADANDVWAEFVTDKVKADLKARQTADGKKIPLQEREMTTAAVGGKTVTAIQSWGAYQQAYMSNFGARRLYVGGAAELNQIISELNREYQSHFHVQLYAQLVQLNILKVEDFLGELRGRHTPYNLEVLSTKALKVIIDFCCFHILNRSDLDVVSTHYSSLYTQTWGISSASMQDESINTDLINEGIIRHYVSLKELGLSASQIRYFAFRASGIESYQGLQICLEVIQKNLLSVGQLVKLYNQNCEGSYDRFHAMTPTFVKYLEEGIITFDMLQSLEDDIEYFSVFVAVDGIYGNKMRALYEGLCQKIKADGVESWELFSATLFGIFAIPFIQNAGGRNQIGSYFATKLADPANNSFGNNSLGNESLALSDVQFWAEIEEGTLSSDSLFALFADLKAIIEPVKSRFSQRLLRNLNFILLEKLGEILEERGNLSFRELGQIARRLARALFSQRNMTELSELMGINLFEALNSYGISNLGEIPPGESITQHPIYQCFETMSLINSMLTEEGFRPKAEMQSFIKDWQQVLHFFNNFKKPKKLPVQFDSLTYVDYLQMYFMLDLMLERYDEIESAQGPALLILLQNFHDNGGVDRFVKAVKAGLSPDETFDENDGDVDWIGAYLYANHQEVLELSDIKHLLKNRKKQNGEFVAYDKTLSDALDVNGQLGALLAGKATKEQWLNGTIDLEALEAIDADSGSVDESGDIDAAAPAVSGRIRGNDDDDGSEG